MKVLTNTGNYFDMTGRVAVVILDTDCEMGGGFGLIQQMPGLAELKTR